MTNHKKLIEVALPLEAINKASTREKSIRHGHPSTLHLWWARRPLAAARAVIFAQMVDDPSAHPEQFPTEEAQEQERQRLFRLIEKLVLWENTTNEAVLAQARQEIWKSWRQTCKEQGARSKEQEAGISASRSSLPAAGLFNPDKLPAFHDPFAGGGSLPLEAQRLGLESYASDLNPVAVLINKAMIEIPPKFAGLPPVHPAAQANPLGARASRPHKQWHSRGYLPHFDQPGLLQSITFRLYDSLPREVTERWQQELGWRERMAADNPVVVELRERIARYEDEGHGHCWLARDDIGGLVEDALLHFDAQRYRLLAWCVMPNHVHVVIETRQGYPLGDVVHAWKSFTAKAANKLLGRRGDFWMADYYDRFIRDEDHLVAAIAYIENNPVQAGLVERAEQWKFSSPAARSRTANAWAGGTPALPGMERAWQGAQGLAEDVRYYGRWMRDEAEKRLGYLYPKIEITAELAAERPDLKPLVGQRLTVIAWLWARTVQSPNPAFRHVDVPLASTFMLSTKAGKEAYVEPLLLGVPASGPHGADGTLAAPGYCFTVKMGQPKDAAVKNGTKLARGANFQCVMSGSPIAGDYIKAEGKAGRMGARLMAIVAEGARGRVYLPPTPEHEAAARQAKAEWKPEGALVADARAFTPTLYGFEEWSDLFTPRQLMALTLFSDLAQEVRERVKRDALAAGMRDDSIGIAAGGSGALAYADAVVIYLGLAIGKFSDNASAICSWHNGAEHQKIRATFGRQAIPMTWDFAEGNPFSDSTGNFGRQVDLIAVVCEKSLGMATTGFGFQEDAASQSLSVNKVVSTDPPYYDNIGYADLSDFFYVWLRRSLRSVFPDLFATLTVPKAEELVAMPYRHGSKEQAETFFLAGMTQAMHRLAEQSHPAFPVTIYYAFKQSESLGARASGPPNATGTVAVPGVASTGWETFLGAVLRAGFAISGTWPIRTELGNRMRGMESNALASSIVLVCRPRPADAPTATRREFVTALKAELPDALLHLQRSNIAPVDLAQAAIGPGMAVYTRYAKVLDAEGKPLSVREALALINQTLDEVLTEQEGDFDADSRWALAWFEQSGFAEGEYGVAETLSKAKNTSVSGMVEAGILISRGGKVRLLRPDELPADWNPTTDPRLTAWEVVHQLIRVLEAGGESAAAELVAKLGSHAETARELAYRLYTLCERKKRATEALSYNGLVQSWPEIVRLARETPQATPIQTALL